MQRIIFPVTFLTPRGCSPLYGRTVPMPKGLRDVLGSVECFQINIGEPSAGHYEVTIDYQGVQEARGGVMDYSDRVIGPSGKMMRLRYGYHLRVSPAKPVVRGVDQFEISIWGSNT